MYIKLYIDDTNRDILDITLPDKRNLSAPFKIKEIAETDSYKLKGKYYIYYTDGLCITQLNFCVYESCIKSKTVEGDYIQISLLLKGKTDIMKKKPLKDTNVKEGMIQWVYLNGSDIKIKLPKCKNNLNYYRIFISKSFYTELLKNEEWITNDSFYKNVIDNKYVHFGQNIIPINLPIIETLTNLTENEYDGIYKKLYIESKLKELFFLLHIQQKTGILSGNGLNTEIFEKLETAKAYLNSNYTHPVTIKQLSKIVFLNELKLKKGFKEAFDTTIHQYVIELKMEKAKKLLQQKVKINEAALLLGYKSTSHFIFTFKKFYGITPKNYF